MSFDCQGFVDFTEPCLGILPQLVRVGCIHEHVRNLRLCANHRKSYCKICLDFDGHLCILTIREISSKV